MPRAPVSSEHGRARFVAMLDETQRAVGGAWANRDDPTPRGCTLPFWVAGARYPGLRLGPAPRSATAAVARVRELWGDRGLAVRADRVGTARQLTGTARSGDLLVFRASARGMTLQGESACLPR